MKYADEFRRWLTERRKANRDEVSLIDVLLNAFTIMHKLGYERAVRVHPIPEAVDAVKGLYEWFVADIERNLREG